MNRIFGSPPERLGRYRLLGRLGEGGMGVVFLAVDEELGRRVAIKWLKTATPEAVDRLRQEAHLHARVEHPAVCRLYEVAEYEGWPYLVMQLVNGRSFDRAAPEMDLETRILLMATLAEGVHAAHAQGLVHRDLKPANLVVEQEEGGTWRAYVMDFGLARDEASGTLTQAGVLMGSPAYMAPEQVSGTWVDARTDVYGLGASLFEILTGRPPFLGQGATEIFVQVQTLEAPRLRSVTPNLGEDLETILQVCLDKDPARRYPSAQALAQDLRRYLAGKPILARKPGMIYRFCKWHGRNRPLTWAILSGLLLLLLVGGSSAWAFHRARKQTARAEYFRREGDQVVNQLQLNWSAPPHDIRPQQSWAWERIRLLNAEASPSDIASMYQATGRILMELGQWEEARKRLQLAWDNGLRDPDLAFRLVRIHIRLYTARLSELHQRHGSSLPKEDLAQLDDLHRKPSLALMSQIRIPHRQVFMDGILAYLDMRTGEAEERFKQVLKDAPWDSLAYQYLGWCKLRDAWELTSQGNPDGARAAFDEAERAAFRSLDASRSLPECYLDLLETRMNRLRFESNQGKDLRGYRRSALEICDEGLMVDPGEGRFHAYKANLLLSESRGLANWSQREPFLDRAQQEAERAAQLNPDRTFCQSTLATIFMIRVERDLQIGVDPGESLVRARAALDSAIRLNPDESSILQLGGYAQFLAGMQAWNQGLDPRPAFLEGAALVKRTCSRASAAVEWGALASEENQVAAASLAFGESPVESLDQAIQAEDRARPFLGAHFNFLTEEARTYRIRAAWNLSQEKDPLPDMEKSLALSSKALESNPGFHEAYQERGHVELLKAWLQDTDFVHLRKARDAYRQALRNKPGAEEALQGLVRVALEAWKRKGPIAEDLRQEGRPALAQLQKQSYPSVWTSALKEALNIQEARSLRKNADLRKALGNLEQLLAKAPLLREEFEPYRAEAVRALDGK